MITSPTEVFYENLQDMIGYRFGDRAILLLALTHTSYGHEFRVGKPLAQKDNERLEFLGDSILGLVVSDILLETYPNSSEGNLSKMRAAIVNERTLALLARQIGLHHSLRLGRSEEATGGREKPSILACALEALIGAIYLDGGFYAVHPVVRALFSELLSNEEEMTTQFDFKTRLQEISQARWKVAPSYCLLSSEGPDHARVFTVEVRVRDRALGRSSGRSKKIAEQSAAQQAILLIEREMSVSRQNEASRSV